MPSLDDLPIDLTLYDSVKHGGALYGSVKDKLGATWKRSIRDIGGYWLATSSYGGSAKDGTFSEGELAAMRDLFLAGLGNEIRETFAGIITWQGFLTQADFTVGGLTYSRRWGDLMNRVQGIYTRMQDNLLANGGAESGSWTVNFNVCDVASGQSQVWVSEGAYSMYIANTISNNGGRYIQQGIPIVAGQAYTLQLSVNVLSVAGTWDLVIAKGGAGGPDGSGYAMNILGMVSTNTLGLSTLTATIPASNTYSGNVDIFIYNKNGNNSKIYCDGGSFRPSPIQARTAWLANTQAQLEYGTLETALLLAGMSDAAANAHVATALALGAWPRTLPPDQFGGVAQPDGLKLTFAGYVTSLRNKYTIRGGTTQPASTHVANAVGDSEFVTAGVVAANAMSYFVDDRAPLRAWEVIQAITRAGDGAGNRWTCGVYANRLFNYQPASTTPDYHLGSTQLLSPDNSQMLSWLAQPGLYYLDDMPIGPGSLSGNSADDPHVAVIEEVEFSAADWLAGGTGLNLKRKAF